MQKKIIYVDTPPPINLQLICEVLSKEGKFGASLGTTHHTFYRDPNSGVLSFWSLAFVRQRCLNL